MRSINHPVVVKSGASGGIGAAVARPPAVEGGRPVPAARWEWELPEVAVQGGPGPRS